MRLKALDRAERLRPRLLLGLFGFVMRKDSPIDVLKTVYHKQRYFGDGYLAVLNEAMRGPSDWTVAERELFATFTSKQNECPFCVGSHAAIVALAPGGPPDAQRLLDDWQNAALEPKVKATLRLLEAMSRGAAAPTSADIEAVRSAGVRDGAIEDAVTIAFCFHVINRLANAFDFHVASPQTFTKVGRTLLKNGYRL